MGNYNGERETENRNSYDWGEMKNRKKKNRREKGRWDNGVSKALMHECNLILLHSQLKIAICNYSALRVLKVIFSCTLRCLFPVPYATFHWNLQPKHLVLVQIDLLASPVSLPSRWLNFLLQWWISLLLTQVECWKLLFADLSRKKNQTNWLILGLSW